MELTSKTVNENPGKAKCLSKKKKSGSGPNGKSECYKTVGKTDLVRFFLNFFSAETLLSFRVTDSSFSSL